MADFITYDGVTGRIIKKYKSIDGSNLSGNFLKVDRATFDTLTKYKKVVGGSVVDMSQVEKDELDVELAQKAKDKLIEKIDKFEVTNLDLFTALIKVLNKRMPNNKITKPELVDQIKVDLGV